MANDNPLGKPIASKARLEQLGMEPSKYASCSEPDQRKIQNKGPVWFNRGCAAYYDCPWRDGTEHQAEPDEKHPEDTMPRPRNLAVKHIKPNSTGPGDIIINSYCPCFRALKQMKRDGRNNEIVEVVGGEGMSINIKSHKKHVNPDNSIYLTPETKSVEVPRYPDPTEVPELYEHVFAAKDRKDHKARTVDAEREKRLRGASRKEAALEGVTPLEVGHGGVAAQTE